MLATWKVLRESVGQSWVREYGDVNGEAIRTWEHALRDFTDDQIARGVRACQSWTKSFPPTIGQFKEMCLTVHHSPNFTEKRMAQEKAFGKPANVIEHLDRVAASGIAQTELDRMRRIRTGEEVETFDVSFHNLGLRARWAS